MKRTTIIVAIMAAATIAAPSHAQYSTDFEGMNANAQGVVLTGQDGYYLPVAGSTDFETFTYSANAYSFPLNPTGGTRFIAGTGEGGTPLTFERAQRDVTLAGGQGTWTIAYDVLAAYTGNLPSAQNLGSVSLQPSASGLQTFIALARWSDPATAAAWNADYVHFNAAGLSVTEQVPDPGFQNLIPREWYRWSTTFDLTTNQITQVSIVGLTVPHSAVHMPQDWFLEGGSAGGLPPTAFRFFAGGSVPGNTLAFDNLTLIPAPGAMALLACGGVFMLRRRR